MQIAVFSPALVLLFVWALLWILMDIHFRDLSPVRRWLVPLLILLLALTNQVLRSRLGAEFSWNHMWLTMHLPFFLIFLYAVRCSVVKMAFMILSAFTFTAPTIMLSALLMRVLPSGSLTLLLSDLISYAAILLLAQFVFRRSFNYLLRYGSDRLFLQFSIVPLVYYIYVLVSLNLDFSSLLSSPRGLLVRYFPAIEVFVFYFLLLSICKSLSETRDLDAVRAVLTRQLSFAEEQLALLNEAQSKTAIYQHDMRHHLNMLDGLLSAGKTSQAEEYIRKVQADVESVTPRRFCENELVNLLCSSFAGKAERMKVRLTAEAQLPGELAISDTELCSILSNGLENALRAADRLEEPYRRVDLYCGIRLNKLLIEIKNPCPDPVPMRDGLPVSGRKGHGYGCRSIRTIALHRGGLCEFKAEDGIFLLRVALPVRPVPGAETAAAAGKNLEKADSL